VRSSESDDDAKARTKKIRSVMGRPRIHIP